MLTGGQVGVNPTDSGIEISAPKIAQREIDTIVALELDAPAIGIRPIDVGNIGQPLTEDKPAKASDVYENKYWHVAAMAVDGDEKTRWATNDHTKRCWLEVDLGKAETFNRAMINECVDYGGMRVKAFELQWQDGNAWKTFFKGTRIGKHCQVKFAPVTARRFA